MINNRIDFYEQLYNDVVVSDKTVRAIACETGISKSMIHRYLRKPSFICFCNTMKSGYDVIDNILRKHFDEKYIKGGESTKEKYKGKSKKKR